MESSSPSLFCFFVKTKGYRSKDAQNVNVERTLSVNHRISTSVVVAVVLLAASCRLLSAPIEWTNKSKSSVHNSLNGSIDALLYWAVLIIKSTIMKVHNRVKLLGLLLLAAVRLLPYPNLSILGSWSRHPHLGPYSRWATIFLYFLLREASYQLSDARHQLGP